MKNELARVLSGEKPSGRVPLWELEFHPWEKFSDKKMTLGRKFEALSASDQAKALDINAEIIAEVTWSLGFSGITVPGQFWWVGPGEPAYFWLPPDARLECIRKLRKLLPDTLLIGAAGGVMAMPGVEIYVEFAYKLYDEPEAIDAMAAEHFQKGIETAQKLRDAGCDAVFTASDIADNRGPYFNPEQMERFILPWLRKWAETIRGMGLYGILHTDGNINPVFDDLCESGVHAIQAIDPVAGMELSASLTRAGERTALIGNIDCGNLIAGTPESVYEETRLKLQACKGKGRLILGASNAVQYEAPAENYRAQLRAWDEFGSMN